MKEDTQIITIFSTRVYSFFAEPNDHVRMLFTIVCYCNDNKTDTLYINKERVVLLGCDKLNVKW